jgi:cytochrome c oxidase assembly protein subunit 11
MRMRHFGLSLQLIILTAAMFGFGFALVPIYNIFCDLTGLGGRTASEAQQVVEQPDLDRTVRLEFIASVNRGAPFEFKPTVSSMNIHPGQRYQTSYRAVNLQGDAITAQAVPSVAPGLAAEHLKKIECFCFTQQSFAASEDKEMGVTFMVDSALPAHIDTLTLSYTLFSVGE